MRADWDRRARENARYFIATGKESWSDEEFFASGRRTVEETILTDLSNICQGKTPHDMRVLEIGCGAGRVTRALAEQFGEVHAVDVSGEMVAHAREALQSFANAHVYQNNGMDLHVLPDLPFDFAFSFIVFQHIPDHQIVENYLREVHRLLRPGGLFKFQVNGIANRSQGRKLLHRLRKTADTWIGDPFSEEEMRNLAARTGFECRHMAGAGTQYFWLWFFRDV
ncbi:MAG TPA: class I SAM-dependent methyltransferase [Bryobacteraceae bacterium]|nr:class I SAM-dependent methyltransferase [Bryobacteraceae bacterium]